jgi:hypothetical protein
MSQWLKHLHMNHLTGDEEGLESLDPWSSRHRAGGMSEGRTVAVQPALQSAIDLSMTS